MTEAELSDVFNMGGKPGVQIIYGGLFTQFQPDANASTTPSRVVDGQALGTSSVELSFKRFTAKPIKDFSIKGFIQNAKQLRTSGVPEAWESPWIFFNVHKDANGVQQYNYVSFKTNGVEVGQGFAIVGQKFRLTQSMPVFVVGTSYGFELIKSGTTLTLNVNGVQAFSKTFAATDLFDIPGTLALYSEDALVVFSDLQVK